MLATGEGLLGKVPPEGGKLPPTALVGGSELVLEECGIDIIVESVAGARGRPTSHGESISLHNITTYTAPVGRQLTVCSVHGRYPWSWGHMRQRFTHHLLCHQWCIHWFDDPLHWHADGAVMFPTALPVLNDLP